MNGATAEPWVRTTSPPNNARTIRIGASQNFLRARRNLQSSSTNDMRLPMMTFIQNWSLRLSGGGPGGVRGIQYVSEPSRLSPRRFLPETRKTSPIGTIVTKYTSNMTAGVTTFPSNMPSFVQAIFNGRSTRDAVKPRSTRIAPKIAIHTNAIEPKKYWYPPIVSRMVPTTNPKLRSLPGSTTAVPEAVSCVLIAGNARSGVERVEGFGCCLQATSFHEQRDVDQGAQYGSDDWMRFCQSNGMLPSMSRRGNCWDNAVAESFFSSLKKERIKKRVYKTRDLARADVFDYIESFYNRTRRHSHIGGVSPEAFEMASF